MKPYKITQKGLLDIYELGQKGAIRSILSGDEYEMYKEIMESQPLTPEEQHYEQIILDIINAHINIATITILESNPEALTQPSWTDTLGPHFQQIIYENEDRIREHLENIYNNSKKTTLKEIKNLTRETNPQKSIPTILKAVGPSWYEGPADFMMRKIVEDYSMSLIKNISDDMRTAIGREIREGLQNSRTVPEIAKRVEGLGIRPIRAGGRMLSPKERATLIARTECNRVSNQASLISYQQYGVKEVDVITAGDKHVCPYCKRIASRGPYPIDNLPGEALLPVHPACGCTYAAAFPPNPTPTDPSSVMDLTTKKPRKVGDGQPDITTVNRQVDDIDTVPVTYTRYSFVDDGVDIYTPPKMNPRRQLLTVDDVMNKYREMPEVMRKQVKSITLTDKGSLQEMESLIDGHYVASYMRETRNVNIYRNGWMGNRASAKQDLTETLHHELAHGVDHDIGEKLNLQYPGEDIIRYSDYKSSDFYNKIDFEGKKLTPWNQAASMDGGPYGGCVTKYAGNHHLTYRTYTEDFAESVKLYMRNPVDFRKSYPRRTEAIEILMGVAV